MAREESHCSIYLSMKEAAVKVFIAQLSQWWLK